MKNISENWLEKQELGKWSESCVDKNFAAAVFSWQAFMSCF